MVVPAWPGRLDPNDRAGYVVLLRETRGASDLLRFLLIHADK